MIKNKQFRDINKNNLNYAGSPYLLQHAGQPVHWQVWSNDVFKLAEKLNRPVFLSIGYATCHWCHVMAGESFNHPEVASFLNKHFINIKVDKEERPDLDEYYMTATQVMTGQGGWPNSLWLTPDKKVWFSGTYFPRVSSHGYPGFVQVLEELVRIWHNQPEAVTAQALEVHRAVSRIRLPGLSRDKRAGLWKSFDQIITVFEKTFDKHNGGFGTAPKFPPYQAMSLLLFSIDRSANEAHKRMVEKTLDSMIRGGIRDHVGGGFHRYSVDEKWHVPHFEKMLYDNAMILKTLARTYRFNRDKRYCQAAEELVEWLIREMQDKSNGYYSAMDADSNGTEGLFYIWKYNEIFEALSEDEAKAFSTAYQIRKEGNYFDELTGRTGPGNIPYLSDNAWPIAPEIRQKLITRQYRKAKPGIDQKIITAWNSLLISSLLEAGRVFKKPEWEALAVNAGNHMLEQLISDRIVYRSIIGGKLSAPGFLSDYAYSGNAFVELYLYTKNDSALKNALKIGELLIDYFYDFIGGGFYNESKEQKDIPLRSKNSADGVLPSANAQALWFLYRLKNIRDDAVAQVVIDRSKSWLLTVIDSESNISASAIEVLMAIEKNENEAIFTNKLITFGTCSITTINKDKKIYGFRVRTKLKQGYKIAGYPDNENNKLSLKAELNNSQIGRILNTGYIEKNNNEFELFGEAVLEKMDLLPLETIDLKISYQLCSRHECLKPEEVVIKCRI